ncbi:MAG: hypothetical protein KKF98_07300, partial [Bacteroidetes bacterium]|nr:hypothetical protein [Bacteroidota bacterium]
NHFRIRKGFRMRAIVGYQSEASCVMNLTLFQEQFRLNATIDGYFSKGEINNLLKNIDSDHIQRTSFYIVAPDKGDYYEGNGELHMILRDNDVKHEYRVKEGNGGFEWMLAGLNEIIEFASKSFHK